MIPDGPFENMQQALNREPFFFAGGDTGVLLIHGWSGSPPEMRGLGEYLAQQGWTVLAVRLAGHGTTLQDFAQSRWQDWVASTEAGWQEISQHCRQVFVAGLSLGGLLAVHLCVQHPARGLVTMAAPTHLASDDWRLRFIGLFKHIIREQSVPEEIRDAVDLTMAQRIWHYDKICVPALHELVKFIAIVREELPRVSVPVLIMQGKGDTNVPLDSAEEIYRHVSSVDKELVWFSNSGHMLPEDMAREEVWQRVAAFVLKRANRL